jgi:hypothetical protein
LNQPLSAFRIRASPAQIVLSDQISFSLLPQALAGVRKKKEWGKWKTQENNTVGLGQRKSKEKNLFLKERGCGLCGLRQKDGRWRFLHLNLKQWEHTREFS